MHNYPILTNSKHKLGILEIHPFFFPQFSAISEHAQLHIQVLEKRSIHSIA